MVAKVEEHSSNDDSDDYQLSEHEISIASPGKSTNQLSVENPVIQAIDEDLDVQDPRLKRLIAVKRETCRVNDDEVEKCASDSMNPENVPVENYKTGDTK